MLCATEPATCTFTGTRTVRFGVSTTSQYVDAVKTASTPCNPGSFGGSAADPAPGQTKSCWYGDAAPGPNPVVTENAKTAAQGVTTNWTISDAQYAANGEIEGYASAASVNRGGT
ncbi:MAG: hypothetical protein JNL98_44045, partial [Bryobacterales bacterium]|nr:hypothetical protein [Bryobacterales bacterium]